MVVPEYEGKNELSHNSFVQQILAEPRVGEGAFGAGSAAMNIQPRPALIAELIAEEPEIIPAGGANRRQGFWERKWHVRPKASWRGDSSPGSGKEQVVRKGCRVRR